MRNRVIGQTGTTVLSDDSIFRNRSHRRTLRYQYLKVQHGWIAWICGPFHSRTYGVCSFGTKRRSAKAALQTRLANDYRYLGHLMFSDVDGSDTVGKTDAQLLDETTVNHPIMGELVGV